MDLTEATTYPGLGFTTDATVSSGIVNGGIAIQNPLGSVSRKRRFRRDSQLKAREVIRSIAPHLTTQAVHGDTESLAVRDKDLSQSSFTEDLDDIAHSESGCKVHCENVILDGPSTGASILELLNRVEDDDDDADDSDPAPCLRRVTKTPSRAGDRLGMVAASERNELAIPEAVVNTQKPVTIAVEAVLTSCLPSPWKCGESRKRTRQDPQERAVTKTTDKKTKKRSHSSTATLTSIRQKTLTDYVTVLRQPGDALIQHGGSSRKPDSDSLLCVVPVRADCNDSVGSETLLP